MDNFRLKILVELLIKPNEKKKKEKRKNKEKKRRAGANF